MDGTHAVEFFLAGLAGCGAGFFTNPLEVVKTRMQLQGELKARGESTIVYRNSLHGLYTIARNDGILAVQKGLVPGLWFQLTMNGVRLGSYQIMVNMGYTSTAGGGPSFSRNVIAAAIAGAIGSWIGSPFYLVKTHLQSRATEKIAVGFQHSHASMTKGFQHIYRESGISGLWRGSYASVMRGMVGSGVQLTTFSFGKHFIKDIELFHREDWRNTLIATMMSAVTITLFMTPFDVVATRLYNQGLDPRGKGMYYKGVFDCFLKISQTEGFGGFYKGWGPQFLRLGPQTILSLFFWDRLRHFFLR